MKNNQLKNKIVSSFQEETPNSSTNLLERCKDLEQDEYLVQGLEGSMAINRKNWLTYTFISLALILVLITGAFLGKLFPSPTAKAHSSVYVDVNPSIELQLDKENIVLDYIANNDDAVLVIGDMKLEGMPLNTAINALIGSMYLNGYLTGEQNSILLSVDTKEQNVDLTLNDLVAEVNGIFSNSEMKCSVIAQQVSKEQHTHEQAIKHNVSLGKMSLIDKIISNEELGYEETDRETLAQLSVHELSLIFSSITSEDSKPDKDGIMSGEVNGFTNEQTVLNTIISDLQISEQDVEHFNMRPTFKHHGDTHSMIYDVILITKNAEYHYVIDCKDGSILEKFEWSDNSDKPQPPQYDGHGGQPPKDERPRF